ncbi:ATP-binding protein [Microbispora triticiradicis]|uniref:ATP-binding protein n=3 Tax=Microbispora TaxID=2005 RepID=A0ABY3LWG4_9ACTN|nr:ATP-binding protein [Microbispora triticiradicis]TLP58610.1 ATP-binding protein [Microbispora fusca]TYB57736.1 ATP-binding protein [Microbispora tritici]
MHGSVPHHDLVQSTNLTRGQIHWSALDWWPPIGWWPEPARGLLQPGSASASATFVLPPRAESVHSARSFAAGTLSGWGMTDLLDGMELVVSELATNALRHGMTLTCDRPREVIRLSLIRRGPHVACAITDPGSNAPVLRDPSPFEPGGLGLHIVESLSACWGWCPLVPQGKAVWAVLAA